MQCTGVCVCVCACVCAIEDKCELFVSLQHKCCVAAGCWIASCHWHVHPGIQWRLLYLILPIV